MNWYKRAQANFFILGKKDNEIFINNPQAAGMEKPGIRLNNGEIIYGDIGHWYVFSLAKHYIGNMNNIESLGFVSFDGAWRTKVQKQDVRKYLDI